MEGKRVNPFKFIAPSLCVFDLEWAPDADTVLRSNGLLNPERLRKFYGQDSTKEVSDKELIEFAKHSFTKNPNDEIFPPLKLAMNQILSVAVVIREADRESGEVESVNLYSDSLLNKTENRLIDGILNTFSGMPGRQIVGYASQAFDIPLLTQRALINGCNHYPFFHRPDKPWEGVDRFAKSNDWHIDLCEAVSSGSGDSRPKLSQIARACKIPAKLSIEGDDVASLWASGDHDKQSSIVEYNEQDALTTYLLWLRMALTFGLLSRAEYNKEIWLCQKMIVREIEEGKAHLHAFMDEWQRLDKNMGRIE